MRNPTKDFEQSDANYNYDLKERLAANLTKLKNAMGWSQKQLAEEIDVSEATMSGYLGKSNSKSLPSLEMLVGLCKNDSVRKRGLIFTLNDLLSANFDREKVLEAKGGHTDFASLDLMSSSFNGVYCFYLFDQSKPVNEQDPKLSRELRFGVMAIFSSLDGVQALRRNNIIAKSFKFSERDQAQELLKTIANAFDTGNRNIDRRNTAITKAFEKESDLYYGELTFKGERAFIHIENDDSDNSLIILYTSSKKTDSLYIGGCGSMVSVTHGDDHMPAAQKIILSRYPLRCSDEMIADHLKMASAPVTTTKESIAIADFCSKLYSMEPTPHGLNLDANDKLNLINSRITQLISNYIEKNICCVATVSKTEDKKVYNLIKASSPDDF